MSPTRQPIARAPAAPTAAARRAGPRTATSRTACRLFSRELSVLLAAGIPLVEAIETLREREHGSQGVDALGRVVQRLRDGEPLSAALAADPQRGDPLLLALIGASERNGQLPRALREHADHLAWAEALRERIVAALVYPAMLLGVGLLVLLFLLLYVLPRFAGVFDGMEQDLPALSRGLLALGTAAASSPVMTLGTLIACPLLALGCWREPRLRAAAAQWAWAHPQLGPRWRLVAHARLYRGLALLLGSGIPVRHALPLIEPVVPAPMRPQVQGAALAIEQGRALSDAFESTGLATPVARRMLRVGERGGAVAAMLDQAAAFHDDEIARLSDLVARAINPALMLVMGVLIGGIVVLMYLPIFTLLEHVG